MIKQGAVVLETWWESPGKECPTTILQSVCKKRGFQEFKQFLANLPSEFQNFCQNAHYDFNSDIILLQEDYQKKGSNLLQNL